MFSHFRLDGWEFLGLLGEALFFARMAIQWLASEKAGRPVIPAAYWLTSLAGALLVFAYAFHLGSLPVLIPQAVGMVFYARGWQLERASRRREAGRGESPPESGEADLPRLSVIVPVHNEEAGLAATLGSLAGQDYPAARFEVIVALNGCTDASRRVAEGYRVRLAEDARSGMSFGKNLGARSAGAGILVFVDADTRLPPEGLRRLAGAAAGRSRFAGTVAGAPDRGGGVVRISFRLANFLTRRRRAHAPGGVIFMDRATWLEIGGFDESLPQGTSTDCIWRGLAAGAEYLFVDSFRAVTSIRRFEKTGIVGQLLAWRRNHRDLAAGRRREVAERKYDPADELPGRGGRG
ncbi:MAG: lipid-A-disaccharide synthase N-terminal domain-containing protein [Planctomycetota bacterium]|jgi:lipid-A-disaccharide synthase-like uncharacterized protein|nr:lipid-A-disaccharide synthase N-terminal domain-containing protein [Planctomycetota bacterium]